MAAEAGGTVVALSPSARAVGVDGDRTLNVNSLVLMGDRIVTGSAGHVQLRLSDDTKLVIGPRSTLLVDEFVVNSKGTADRIALKAVRGAFRFITGNSRKQAYSIATPTATIGIRGTEFDFAVEADGTTNLVLFDGTVKLCDRRKRRCLEITGSGSLASTGPRARPERVLLEEDRKRIIDEMFPYIRSERQLVRDFRVGSSSCGTRRAKAPESGSAPKLVSLPPVIPPIDPVITGSFPGNPGNGKPNGNSNTTFNGKSDTGNSGNNGNNGKGKGKS